MGFLTYTLPRPGDSRSSTAVGAIFDAIEAVSIDIDEGNLRPEGLDLRNFATETVVGFSVASGSHYIASSTATTIGAGSALAVLSMGGNLRVDFGGTPLVLDSFTKLVIEADVAIPIPGIPDDGTQIDFYLYYRVGGVDTQIAYSRAVLQTLLAGTGAETGASLAMLAVLDGPLTIERVEIWRATTGASTVDLDSAYLRTYVAKRVS